MLDRDYIAAVMEENKQVESEVLVDSAGPLPEKVFK